MLLVALLAAYYFNPSLTNSVLGWTFGLGAALAVLALIIWSLCTTAGQLGGCVLLLGLGYYLKPAVASAGSDDWRYILAAGAALGLVCFLRFTLRGRAPVDDAIVAANVATREAARRGLSSLAEHLAANAVRDRIEPTFAGADSTNTVEHKPNSRGGIFAVMRDIIDPKF
jgi:hypothetical protein